MAVKRIYITFETDEELKERAEKRAKEQDRSMSAYIRHLIKKDLDETPSA